MLKREHISYSELKDWTLCPHYHKKAWVERVSTFEGNEYTAFGTTMHDVCEKKLLKEDIDEAEVFQIGFDEKLQELMEKNIEVNGANVEAMRSAGPAIRIRWLQPGSVVTPRPRRFRFRSVRWE